MSDWLEGQVRTHIFRTGSFTKPTVLAIALCTAAPTDASTGATITEVDDDGTGYARQTLNPLDANWTAASSTDGKVTNASAITWTADGGDFGTVTHVAILDSATVGAGNMLFWAPLGESKSISDGDSLTLAAGSLSVTFA